MCFYSHPLTPNWPRTPHRRWCEALTELKWPFVLSKCPLWLFPRFSQPSGSSPNGTVIHVRTQYLDIPRLWRIMPKPGAQYHTNMSTTVFAGKWSQRKQHKHAGASDRLEKKTKLSLSSSYSSQGAQPSISRSLQDADRDSWQEISPFIITRFTQMALIIRLRLLS